MVKRRQGRRAAFVFGLTYETPLDVLAKIPELLEEIVRSEPKLRFEEVRFNGFGSSSLDFEVLYFVESPWHRAYAASKRSLDLEMRRRFAGLGALLAFPARSLCMVVSSSEVSSSWTVSESSSP